MPPVRITTYLTILHLLLSPRHLWKSICHQVTSLINKASENRFDPGPDCTDSICSKIPIQKIWSDLDKNGKMRSGIFMQQQKNSRCQKTSTLILCCTSKYSKGGTVSSCISLACIPCCINTTNNTPCLLQKTVVITLCV